MLRRLFQESSERLDACFVVAKIQQCLSEHELGGARSVLAFADGHLETHKWRYPSTKPPARPDAVELRLPIPARELGDFDWLMYRTTVDSDYDVSPAARPAVPNPTLPSGN